MSMSNFQAVVPEGAPVSHVQPTEAPPAQPDLIEQLYVELGDKVPPALEQFVGQTLAKFAWKSRAANGVSGQLDVVLEKATRSARAGAQQLTLDFRCTPKSGAAVSIAVIINPVRSTKNGTLLYRSNTGGSFRAWDCAAVVNDELRQENAFSRPTGIAAIEHFGTVWFGNQQDALKQGIASGVERVGHPIVHPKLAELWPKYSLSSKKREWAVAKAPTLLHAETISLNADEWAAGLLVFCLWGLLLRTLAEPEESIAFDGVTAPDARGLPNAEAYWPRRSVDLTAPGVQDALLKEGLVIPWHVVEAACAALNAGKHVIFTGPPGCGKSKLSGVLASLATGRDPLMVTASPAWTSGDLVGRYFPRRDGNGLEFKPGFFLRAIDEGNRWLVIDEFNRANIDECFGELFSVLADDVVELPFEEELQGKTAEGAEAVYGQVRIVPPRRGGRAEAAAHTNTVNYEVGPAFRLIGTMNDADRSSLHQLSFALLRRFHIIRVEAPAAQEVEKVIRAAMARASDDLMLSTAAYRLTRKGKRASALELDMILPRLTELFARDLTKRTTRSYTDLVQERVVGLATVQDILRFVAEGIRGPSQGKDVAQVATDHLTDDLSEHTEATCASFLAIGVALSVFPQLDALTADARLAAVKHMVSVFNSKGDKPLLMRRIVAGDPGSDCALKIALIDHTDPTDYDFDQDHYVSVAEFLVEELCQQYRGTEEAEEFGRLLATQ
jgi:MoxR-like ATPase